MKKIDINYVDLLQLIEQGKIGLKAINTLMGIIPDEVEHELKINARYLGESYSSGGATSKPVYSFQYKDCPMAAQMVQWAKVYSFKLEGSAYATHEISTYDSREQDPYTQVMVYDSDMGMFVAGLRDLPLYKGISYEKSTMNKLFKPTNALIPYFNEGHEFGATFVIPEVQGTTAAQHYLFSAMAFSSVLNEDAKYLVG